MFILHSKDGNDCASVKGKYGEVQKAEKFSKRKKNFRLGKYSNLNVVLKNDSSLTPVDGKGKRNSFQIENFSPTTDFFKHSVCCASCFAFCEHNEANVNFSTNLCWHERIN